MPPGGVHLMSGLGFIRASSKAFHASETLRNAVGAALHRLCPQVDDRDRWKAFSVGIVCGTILPDADLLLCIMIGAVGAISEEDLKVFHRTFSHSLVVVPALAAALVYWLRCLEARASKPARRRLQRCALGLGLLRDKDGSASSTSSAPQAIALFVVSCAVGCAIHSFLDLFYVMRLQLFYPVAYEVSAPILFPLETLTERQKKLLMVFDFASDAAFWYLPLLLYCGSRRGRRGGAERWKFDLLLVLVASYAACLSFFSRDAWLSDSVTTVLFTRRLYIFGTLWVTMLKVSPIVFHDEVFAALTAAPAPAPKPSSPKVEGGKGTGITQGPTAGTKPAPVDKGADFLLRQGRVIRLF